MAINLTEDINHSGGGKIVSVAQSAGSWQSIATKGDFDNFTSDTTTKQNLTNGQFFYVLDESQLYKLTVAGFGPFATYTLGSASFGGGSTPDGTVSGSQQISDFGFVSSDATSSFVLVDVSSSFFQSMSFDDSTNLLSIEGGNIIDLSALTGSGGGSGTGIFALTGSIYSTTNNIEVTGSFEVGGGLFKLTEFTTTPTAEEGAIYYSASNFYFGVE